MAYQTKLPARMQAPILGIPVPIAIGGHLAALAPQARGEVVARTGTGASVQGISRRLRHGG